MVFALMALHTGALLSSVHVLLLLSTSPSKHSDCVLLYTCMSAVILFQLLCSSTR